MNTKETRTMKVKDQREPETTIQKSMKIHWQLLLNFKEKDMVKNMIKNFERDYPEVVKTIKQETAKQIFEDIEDECEGLDFFGEWLNSKEYEELKKKYTKHSDSGG